MVDELSVPETAIEHLGEEVRSFDPPADFAKRAVVGSMERYRELYERSVKDPEGFWGEMATEHLEWMEPFTSVLSGTFEDLDIKWFDGGKLNVSANCLDRHLTTWRRNKAALIWETDDGKTRTFTYQQLHYEVSRFANVLKKKGVEKGDRVSVYLPMVPELVIAMLACTRIGAIHSVVFGGFSAAALRDRIQDCGAKMLITADEGLRGGRVIQNALGIHDPHVHAEFVLVCFHHLGHGMAHPRSTIQRQRLP